MKKYHEIQKIQFVNDKMILKVDGKDHVFMLKDISKPLLKASHHQRATHRISASGYGIHWPLIDEDLSIDGMLGIKHHPPKVKAKATV